MVSQFSIKLRKILLCDSLYYAILILSTIFSFLYIKYYGYESIYNIDQTTFNLRIHSYKIDGDKLSLELKDKENLVGTYYFKTEEELNYFVNNYSIGDTINLSGTLNIPSNNTMPNTFNYKNYLKYKKIYYTLSIESFSEEEVNKNILYKLKNFFYKRIYKINNNEFIYALILGDSSHINGESFRNNGVSHLFALSGLHVSLISLILLKILSLVFKEKDSSIIPYIIIFIILFIYSFITGLRPSLLRATFFFLLIGINKVYYLNIKGYNLLIIVYLIMIIINPFVIKDISFLLSWSITFSLLFTSELYKTNNYILNLFRTSLIALLCSLPIVVNSFYTVNILSLINNLLFVPFVSYIIYPLSMLTFIFNKLNGILLLLTTVLNKLSIFFESIKIFTFSVSKLNTYEIIIYYLLILIIVKSKKKIKFILLLFLFILFLYIKPYFRNHTSIYYLDVSQGDSSLVVMPSNKSILIDTGGIKNYSPKELWKQRTNSYNLMKSSIIPFIKSMGVKKINYLILTHGDFDHMGEAINLVNNFKVEKVIFNCGPYNDLEKNLIKVLDKKKIKYYSCIKELNIDNSKLYFLQTKKYDNENDNSNVIYTELNGYKFLFMGDAGVEKEKDILDKYNISNIDVLKVGHHGSKTSSSESFINEINPRYSIISVGKNNRYGHPNKEVLNNLNNSKIYRTDQDGSIMIGIKNSKLKVETSEL